MAILSVISAISAVISIAELTYKGYKWIDNLEPAIDKVYARALERWTRNNGVRTSYSYRQFSTVQELGKYLIDKDSAKGETKLLLEYFEEELKKDSSTYSKILQRENLNISRNIQTSVTEIKKEVSEGFSQILSQNQTTNELLSLILEKIESKQKAIIPATAYQNIEDYIPRTVRTYSSYNFNMYLEKEKYEPKRLIWHILEDTKRIVLYSDAQLGKTTELRRLAFELCDSGLYNPYIFNLNRYNGLTPLEELVKISNRFNGDKIDVLILDGLDEVADKNRVSLIIDIENIAADYPQLFIVVSCRSNFEGTNTISGFQKLYLNQLKWEEIEDYIKDKCARSDDFIRELQEKGYYEMLYSPFYLNESIEYFKEQGELPLNKATIYEYFIDKCFEVDKKKKPREETNLLLKAEMYPILQHIAFCMLASQRQEISIDELFSELHFSKQTIDGCLHISLFENNEENKAKFIHNSFKEYIVAKYLSRLTFQQVQSVLCYKGTKKIKPTMYNTSVLLLGVIQKDQELFEPFMKWLINDYKELLVRCGFEVLGEAERDRIFKDVFNDYKQKHLWIGHDLSNSLIHFANTKETLLFILEQIKGENSYSTNMINALHMLKYAKFFMLTGEFNEAKELLLSVLSKYKGNIGNSEYLCRPFENEFLLSTGIIADFFEVIKDTSNCEIINYLCTLASKTDVCDQYADWVFSKIQYICNYTDEKGVGHSVSKDYLFRFLRNLREPQNIIKAINYSENIKEDNRFWPNEDTIQDELFRNLSQYSDGSDDIIETIISNIKLMKQKRITSSIAQGYYTFIEATSNAQEIYEKHYRQALQLLEECGKEKDDEKWKQFNQLLNVVVVLMDDNRLDAIINDRSTEESLNHWLCNNILSYPSITGEFVTKINLRFEHQNKWKIDWKKRKQDAFDILWDRKVFTEQIEEIIAGKDRINTDIDNRRDFFSDNTNNSVIDFIWWCHENEQEYAETSRIREKLQDDVEYICFVISHLPIPSHLREDEHINVSDIQKEKLTEIINYILENPSKFNRLSPLLNIIVEYDLVISDQSLLSLLPYAAMNVSYKGRGVKNGKFHGSSIFLDFLSDKISDKHLVDRQIENLIMSDSRCNDRLWLCLTYYIVSQKKCNLYRYFSQLMNKQCEYSYKLDVATRITELGREGLEIVKPMLKDFSDKHLIYYYEYILFPEDKSIIKGKEREEICKVLEEKYPICAQELKEKVLDILICLGSEKALDWGLEYMQTNKEWVEKDHFPSFHNYDSRYLKQLSCYYEIATSIELTDIRMHNVFDATINVLRCIANESEEMRDKVVEMFRQKAQDNNFPYLYRIADETYDKFFENNFGVMSLGEASNCYMQI